MMGRRDCESGEADLCDPCPVVNGALSKGSRMPDEQSDETDIEIVDPETAEAIELLSIPGTEGADKAMQKAIEAHLADLADAQPEGAKIPTGGPWTPFAHSYAGNWSMTVVNPDHGRSFGGNILISPSEDGTYLNVAGDFAFVGTDERCELAGRAELDDQDLVMTMSVADPARPIGFDARLSPILPFEEDWLPVGTIECQQAPEDPALNGGIQLKPRGKAPDDKRVVLSVVKVPRRDKDGKPVTEGTGDKKKPVYDYYFWRDGKWWRIKDPKLKLRDDPTLIDLRDGTGNRNYEPAKREAGEKLDRTFFPTGWQDFWKGFEESTARQLQGLAITLSALTGTDLLVWRKIRRMRDQGKSWAQIWGACWLDILKIVGWMLVLGLPLAKLLGRIFGPFVKRFKGKLLNWRGSGRPPTPPMPPNQLSAFQRWLLDQWRRLMARQRELIARLRRLRELARRSSTDQKRLEREGPRLMEKINSLGNEIEQMRRTLGRMGLM
jgi:hypothetical protein